MPETSKAQVQEEHELISTSLEVEQLDVNLFRSLYLWKPRRARGVFGGQVISQAVISATKCVPEKYMLHSLHCYFLLSASPSIRILYYVERLRHGKTYTTCSVKAVQEGRIIFMMLCSFQIPELGQPSHAMPMPLKVLSPEECPYEEEMAAETLKEAKTPAERELIELRISDRKRSPIAIKHAPSRTMDDGTKVYLLWMKAKAVPKYPASYQKCILAYISDMWLLSTAARQTNLKWGGNSPDSLSMQSSLDHSLYFYNHEFDTGDWMLYVMISPRLGMGRGFVYGRIYDRKGTLCAVVGQEGVVRTYSQAIESKSKL